MALTISLRKQSDNDDEELLLFPEAGGAPLMPERAVQEEPWLASQDEGRLAVDVYESESEIVIKSPIAGVRTEDLEVFVHNDMLTVRGRRTVEEEKGARPLVRECHWGSFSRSVILPTEVDVDHIAAALRDGVLTVRLPKVERSRKISVKELQ
jgi:HSP20 family protein